MFPAAASSHNSIFCHFTNETIWCVLSLRTSLNVSEHSQPVSSVVQSSPGLPAFPHRPQHFRGSVHSSSQLACLHLSLYKWTLNTGISFSAFLNTYHMAKALNASSVQALWALCKASFRRLHNPWHSVGLFRCNWLFCYRSREIKWGFIRCFSKTVAELGLRSRIAVRGPLGNTCSILLRTFLYIQLKKHTDVTDVLLTKSWQIKLLDKAK